MTDPAQIVDHSDRGVGRLLAKLQGKPRLAAFLRSWIDSAQELEDVVFAMRTMMLVSDATGWWLDRLGAIVGERRRGRTDDIYRVWVAARTLVNRSSGTGPQLIAIVKAVVAEDSTVYVEDQYPAAMLVHVYGETDIDTGNALAELLQQARCPGVRCVLHWSVDPEADVFRFADALSVSDTDVDYGFGSGVLSIVNDGRGGESGDVPPITARYGALWYRADSVVEDDEGRVETASDVLGTGFNLTQTTPANRPEATTVGGAAAIRYDASSERLAFDSLPASLLPAGSYIDWWVVLREDRTTAPAWTYQKFLDGSDGVTHGYGFNTMVHYPSTRQISVGTRTPEGVLSVSVPVPASSGLRLVHARHTATGLAVSVDAGTITGSTALANSGLAQTIARVEVGNAFAAIQAADGEVFEVYVARGLSSDVADQITALLAAEHGIAA